MTLGERIEKGADEILRIGAGIVEDNDAYNAAEHLAEIMFPEIFTDPPTMWLAPWEATNDMISTAQDEFHLKAVQVIGDVLGMTAIAEVYQRLRTAHLDKPEGT